MASKNTLRRKPVSVVGKKFDKDITEAEICVLYNVKLVRVLRPNSTYTCDFNPDRLNVCCDDYSIIESVHFG